MFHVERLTDPRPVEALFDAYWDRITDDSSPACASEAAKYVADPGLYYLAAKTGESIAALAFLHPLNGTTWVAHIICPMPGKTGAEGIEAMKRWFWENTDAEAVLALSWRREAGIMARWVGFKEIGVVPRSFRKGGKLYDQRVFVLTRGG